MRFRVGIVGYGNLGRGAEAAVCRQGDMQLAGLFSRREGLKSASRVLVYPMEALMDLRKDIDVLLLCCGSARDLPQLSPRLSREFPIADTYDNHKNAAAHIAACHNDRHAAIVCAGWDPGLFSLQRVLAKSIFPENEPHTFWGPGVSQGHSNALRQLEGVLDARQYTLPDETAVEKARQGRYVPAGDKHRRLCLVAADPGADREQLRAQILALPQFAGEQTQVRFVSREELSPALPHGGLVIGGAGQLEMTLKTQSNPMLTGAVLAACGRAVWRLEQEGRFGAKTLLDVPASYLCPIDAERYI